MKIRFAALTNTGYKFSSRIAVKGAAHPSRQGPYVNAPERAIINLTFPGWGVTSF